MAKRVFAINDLLTSQWFITDEAAQSYLPILANFIEGKEIAPSMFESFGLGKNQLSHDLESLPIIHIDSYGDDANQLIGNAAEGTVMVLDLVGGITKYDAWCGPAGTMTKASFIKAAAANENISGIVINIDTPGGEASAVEYISREILQAKQSKPVIAYVNGYCASAGYWIASNCTEIIMDGKLSAVGSIGVYQTIVDMSKRLEAMGISMKQYYSKRSPKKNEEYRALLEGNDKPLIEALDYVAQVFAESVKAQRQSITDPAAFEGRLFYSEKAIEVGLADREGTFQDAINAASFKAGTDKTNNTEMKKITLKAGWVSLLSFLNLSVPEGKESLEHELTEAELENLNGLATKVTDLTQKLADKEKEYTASAKKVKELEAELASRPGGHPSSGGKAEEEEAAAELAAKDKIVDPNADHYKLAADLGIKIPNV